MADKESKKSVKKKVIVIGSGGLIILAFVFYLAMASNKNDFLRLTDAPIGTKVEALIEVKGRVQPLSQMDKTFSASDFFAISDASAYRIRTSLKMPWGDYRDIVLNVSRKQSLISVLADGFTEDDMITFSVDGKTLYQNIPMDWSGRLELKSSLLSKKEIQTCVRIDGQMGAVGFCHVIPKESA